MYFANIKDSWPWFIWHIYLFAIFYDSSFVWINLICSCQGSNNFFQKLRKKEMNTLTYQKHVLFCLKLITFFYLNAISIVERQYIFKITMLEYLLFLFMYLYNIVTSKIKWCCFKIQNPVDLAFISMLITVD